MAISLGSTDAAPASGTVVAPRDAHVSPLRTRDDFARMRAAAIADPGAFHGDIARRELHWFVIDEGRDGAWLTWDDAAQAWTGWDARTGAPVRSARSADYAPWAVAFDESDAPFYRWFSGGLTNAGFNEVDRHVLAGHGDEAAVIFEGDRWDMSLDGGRGGPVDSWVVTRRQLLLETAKCALALQSLGLRRGDRIALNMPNIPQQLFWTEAAKRLGILYTPVFGGFSDKTLSDRIHDAGARVVITADGGYRNAQVVPFKTAYTDPALDDYVPLAVARDAVRRTLDQLAVPAADADAVLAAVDETLAGEITVQRADVMRGVGRALRTLGAAHRVNAAEASRIRTAVAAALVATPPRVDAVVVVRHTAQEELVWRPERDRWAHDLTEAGLALLLANARDADIPVTTEAELLALDDATLVRAIWASVAPVPLDAEFPLFFIYTSGSTGKPKGVVHVHGGWLSGVAHSMKVAFDARPGDVLYVVADPGWITGQAYMISAALATRTISVLTEGAPVFPHAGRFASIIERYKVAIFKAGVTFLKAVMTDPQNVASVRRYDLSSLRVATFCAEPTSPAVQQFGMDTVVPWYINSYWATEHGGIAFTHFYGNGDFPLRADAHTWALPWVLGDVWVPTDAGEAPAAADPARGERLRAGESGVPWRRAADGEKGEIVVAAPYPYLARTVWGDAEGFRPDFARVVPSWRGDLRRWT
nr:AMP-binding protein [Gemmatimonadaceae bacterium]